MSEYRKPVTQAEWAQFYKAHHTLVCKLVRKLANNILWAQEDLVQEVWIRIARKIDEYDPALGALGTWVGWQVRAVVANWCRDNVHVRNRRNMVELQDGSASWRGAPGTSNWLRTEQHKAIENTVLEHQIVDIIGRLADRQGVSERGCEALKLLASGEYCFAEAAREVGRSREWMRLVSRDFLPAFRSVLESDEVGVFRVRARQSA